MNVRFEGKWRERKKFVDSFRCAFCSLVRFQFFAIAALWCDFCVLRMGHVPKTTHIHAYIQHQQSNCRTKQKSFFANFFFFSRIGWIYRSNEFYVLLYERSQSEFAQHKKLLNSNVKVKNPSEPSDVYLL